jgi:hypothetical protein
MTVKGSNMPGVADPGFIPSDLYLPPLPFGTRPVMATWNGTEWIYSPAGVSGETHDIEKIISESKTVLEENGLTAEQTKEILSIIERGVAEGKSTETIIHEITSKLETFHLEKVVIEKIVTSIEHIIETSALNVMNWAAEFVLGATYKVGETVKVTKGLVNLEGVSTSYLAVGLGSVTGRMLTPDTGQIPGKEAPFFDVYQVNSGGSETVTLKVTEADSGRPELNALQIQGWDHTGKLVPGISETLAVVGREYTVKLGGKGIFYLAFSTGAPGVTPPQYKYTVKLLEGVEPNMLAGAGVYINQLAGKGEALPGSDPTHWVPTSLSGETGEAAAALKLAEEAKTLAESVSRNVVTPQVSTPEGAEKPVKVVAWENNVNTGQVISFIAALELTSVNPGAGGYVVKLYRDGVEIETLTMAILLVLTDVANATAFLRHKVEEGGHHKWEITIESTGEANNLSCHPGLVQITGN